jgi:hypothetical protein
LIWSSHIEFICPYQYVLADLGSIQMSPYALEESDNVAVVNFTELDRLVMLLAVNKKTYLFGVHPPTELFGHFAFILQA